MNEKIYQTKQAQEVIQYVREKYGDELEFLWSWVFSELNLAQQV